MLGLLLEPGSQSGMKVRSRQNTSVTLPPSAAAGGGYVAGRLAIAALSELNSTNVVRPNFRNFNSSARLSL